MAISIGRRQFISALGGAAVAWPFAAHAQQPKPVRRIGVLMTRAADDPEGRAYLGAFVQGLQEAGWADGRNLEIDTRYAAGDAGLFRKYASELVALEPDVLLAPSTPAVAALQQASRTVPIVFVRYFRSDRIWLRGELLSAGREYHWIHQFRSNCRRQVVGAAQRDRTLNQACFDVVQPRDRQCRCKRRHISAVDRSSRARPEYRADRKSGS